AEMKAEAERDVTRRVLVEERVVEDGAERADASVPVHERELAEPRRAVVAIGLRPERAGVLVRVDLDRAAALEPHPEPADDGAVAKDERLRRRDVPVDAVRVGRREDLLGREVREVPDAEPGGEVAGEPAAARQQADRELGSGTAELDRVEAAVAQRLGRALQ